MYYNDDYNQGPGEALVACCCQIMRSKRVVLGFNCHHLMQPRRAAPTTWLGWLGLAFLAWLACLGFAGLALLGLAWLGLTLTLPISAL